MKKLQLVLSIVSAVLVALVFSFSLAACSASVDEENGEENTSTTESGKTDGLPAVTVKWEIISGGNYACLCTSEGFYLDSSEESTVYIANTNYSTSVQPITLRLILKPENEAYKTETVSLKLKAAALPTKDIDATLLFDGNAVLEKQTLGSAKEALLSYEVHDSISVTAKWEVESGGDYILKNDSNDSLKISNVNCSGESKEVTIKVTLSPDKRPYTVTRFSITFIAEDSAGDMQPGEFTASADLGVDATGNYDGTVTISWSERYSPLLQKTWWLL